MMLYEAFRLGIATSVLDPNPDAPCADLANRFVCGRLDDEAAIRELAEGCDVITWEIEHVGIDVLERLACEGMPIAPRPSVLRTIHDKLAQKRFLSERGIPVPVFAELPEERDDFSKAAERFGYPLIQKSRFGGYDGRGVYRITGAADLEHRLEGPSMAERLVAIEREVAVLVARSTAGETVVFPVVDMEFDPNANICTMVSCPSRLSQEIVEVACRVAADAVAELDATGVVAVELFVTATQEVLVNEIAPRPHNSGHLSIEACRTSQFEQHLRAILGLPLGDPALIQPAAMVNLLGARNSAEGPAGIRGYEEILATPGASVHWYGKAASRPNRKMGHVTVTAEDVDTAVDLARRIRDGVAVLGGNRVDR
jgi:5-(carboxyamino)imidazole ribonucleotide synthase